MFVECLEIKAAYKGCYYRADPEVQVFFILYLSQHLSEPGAHSLSLSAGTARRLACWFLTGYGPAQTWP